MTKSTTATVLATIGGLTICGATIGGLTILASLPASAADVRAELTPDLIYEHCLAAGVGTETEGTFMLSGGRRISGSVLCTPEDLVASNAGALRGHGHDDNDDDEDDEDDDDDDDDDRRHHGHDDDD